MNYGYLNKIHLYWREGILPNLAQAITVSSFDDYLKKFSFLKSGRWLREMDNVKLCRLQFVVDPIEFSKKYKSKCITYNSTLKPEDGFMRAIYQISPTLHIEVGYWIWIEQDEVQAYTSLFVCYYDEEEFVTFMDDLYKLRREGDTAEKALGFGAKMSQKLS